MLRNPTADRLPYRLFSILNLRRGEAGPMLAAALLCFLVLAALMLLRPVRDALGMAGGIESVRWLFAGTALVTLSVNPVFGWLVSRLGRMQIIGATYGFFALGLATFWILLTLAPDGVGERSGQVFFVWFSVLNLFATMVFWALLADCFTSDQARRLFAPVSAGGTLGAIFGPWLATRLAGPVGTPGLLLVAGAFLLLAIGIARLLQRLAPSALPLPGSAPAAIVAAADERIGGSAWAGVGAVFRSRYLAGISGFVLLMSIVATFVYFTRLQMVAAASASLDERTAILGGLDMWTQVAVLVLQLALTGKLVERFGLGVALAVLPAVTALGFVGLAFHGSFAVLVLLEAGNRAVQRGITRPAREALFTVVDREDKYKAKALIDTFVYRAGDVAGAQLEGVLGKLGLAMGGLAGVVVPLALAWMALAAWLGRRGSRGAHKGSPGPGAVGNRLVSTRRGS